MRLFCFSDTHQAPMPICAPEPDAWLFAGDLYNRPSRHILSEADVTFAAETRLWSTSRAASVFAVRGNHDTNDRADFFESCNDLSLGDVRKLDDGLYVAGLGWAGDRYFELPTETELVERCLRLENKASLLEGRFILLTHYPPFDARTQPAKLFDDGFFFKCIFELIKALKPIVVVAGHIHDHFGACLEMGGSRVVFPGPVGKWLSIDGASVAVD